MISLRGRRRLRYVLGNINGSFRLDDMINIPFIDVSQVFLKRFRIRIFALTIFMLIRLLFISVLWPYHHQALIHLFENSSSIVVSLEKRASIVVNGIRERLLRLHNVRWMRLHLFILLRPNMLHFYFMSLCPLSSSISHDIMIKQ